MEACDGKGKFFGRLINLGLQQAQQNVDAQVVYRASHIVGFAGAQLKILLYGSSIRYSNLN